MQMKSNEYSGTHQAGKIYDEEAVYDGDDVLSGGTVPKEYIGSNYGAIGDFEKVARLGFIRRVYGILACQLLLTTAVSALCMYNTGARNAVLNHPAFLWVGYIFSFILLLALLAWRQRHPLNLALLTAWTGVMAYTIGVVCAAYTAAGAEGLVIQAFAITLTLFIALSAFTLQSKIDFSFLGLFACLWVLILWSIINAITGFGGGAIYSLFGAIIFSLYIVFDTYMLSTTLGHDEYILAAINLYLDVLNLFLFILQLLASNRN